MRVSKISIRLKLWKKDKLVFNNITDKPHLMLHLKKIAHDKSYVCVKYLSGGHNDSEHTTDDSLLRAVESFTSRALTGSLSVKEKNLC